MFYYYHIYPTCPHCLEPHFKGINLIKCNNNYSNSWNSQYRCISCDAVFKNYVNLSEYEETKKNINFSGEELKIPLVWNIELNPIEEDYINWIDEIDGKYLITWPWDEVKFIPIFITEYISKYPDNKIMIIDDFLNNSSPENVMKPNSLNIFESLIYSSTKSILNPDLKKEYKNFSYKNIFEKIVRFHHMLSFKVREDRSIPPVQHYHGIYPDKTPRNYNRMIIDELKKEYSENCIRENFVNGDRIDRYCNEEGFIDLKVLQEFSWTQKNYKFKNSQLWEAIINIPNFNRSKDNFKYTLISEDQDLKLEEDFQIYFVSKDLPNLFDVLNDINPSLVLFSNADYFMINYSIYFSELGRSFKNYIENTFSNCLLFSTDKDARHLYLKNDFLNECGISLHTWDTDLLLSQIDKTENFKKTAGSNSFDLIDSDSTIEFSFLEINELNDFEKFINELYEKTQNRPYYEYLSKLLRTPLLAYSEKSYLELKLFKKDINFESIINDLDYTNPDLCKELLNYFEKFYIDEKNPILTKILDVAKKQSGKIDVKRVLIVLSNKYESQIFKKILDEKDVELPDSIEISYWNQLNDFSDINYRSVVVSTSYPQINYKLYSSNLKEFIFIGSKNYLEKIETIVENRVDRTNSRPLNYNSSVNYPKLLKNILENSEVINDIENVSQYFFEDEIKIEENENIMSVDSIKKSTTIKKDETALLLLDNDGNGLFIPKKYNVMYKHPENIVAVDLIDEKNYNKLKNKTIVLNRNDFMISFKDIFYKFIVDEGSDIEIISGQYKWKNFYDLINSVFDWRKELDNCLTLMKKEYSYLDYDEKLALELSQSRTEASDVNYIKNFWLSNDKRYNITTKQGTLTIYDIEIPKSPQKDLIEIFTVIHKHNNAIDIEEKAIKNFIAYKRFKKIRESFLKHEKIDLKFNHIYLKFKQELELIIKRQESFKVWNIKKVKLVKPVTPFQKMRNFNEYYNE